MCIIRANTHVEIGLVLAAAGRHNAERICSWDAALEDELNGQIMV